MLSLLQKTIHFSTLVLTLLFVFTYPPPILATKESKVEKASNPLAKVKNTDLRWQYFDIDSRRIDDIYIDGASMALDNLKMKYELHYWESEQNFESATLKGIFSLLRDHLGRCTFQLLTRLDLAL